MHDQEEAKWIRAGVTRRTLQMGLTLLVQATLLLGAAGRLDWGWPGVYLGMYVAGIAVNALLLRSHPDVIAARASSEGAKDWDRVVGGLWALAYLEVLLLVAAGALFSWAMHANAFFATAVRVQPERGHVVIDSGPYAFVRHRGYVGFPGWILSTPLLLPSASAFVPALLAVVLLVIRTALEDRTLQAELAGYPEYAARVPFRLIPGVW